MKRTLFSLTALLAVVTTSDGQLSNDKMMKIVTRDTSPDLPDGAFARKPKTMYRMGSTLGRIEEAPDPANGLHELIVVNEPKLWMINLEDQAGRLTVDPGPTYVFRASIIPHDEKGLKPPLEEFEFGREYQFLREHKAAVAEESIEGKSYDAWSVTIEGYRIKLLSARGSEQPAKVVVSSGEGIVCQYEYDEYESNLPPRMSLFEPPQNVRIIEESDNEPDDWMTFYYLKPNPDEFVAQVRAMAAKGYLDDGNAQAPIVAALSQIMRQNASQIGTWLDELRSLSKEHRTVLMGAAWYSNTSEAINYFQGNGLKEYAEEKPPAILEMEVNSPETLDMLWGYFFATGDSAAIRRIISSLELAKYAGALDRCKESAKSENDKKEAYLDVTYQAAMWSLENNCSQHGRVLMICEEVFQDKRTPKIQSAWLGVMLAKVAPARYQIHLPNRGEQTSKK